jgi:glutaredoxin
VKEFLSQKGIPFQELNVSVNAGARQEMVSRTGMMAVPTVVVGNEYVVGFDKEKLERILH